MDDCERPRWLCKLLGVGTDAVIPDGVSVKADNEARVDAADKLAGLDKICKRGINKSGVSDQMKKKYSIDKNGVIRCGKGVQECRKEMGNALGSGDSISSIAHPTASLACRAQTPVLEHICL